MLWPIARGVAARIVPVLLAGAIVLMVDAELLDGQLADGLLVVLRGW